MQDLIHILKNNWNIILSIVLFVASFIVCLIKKKPIKVLTSIYDFLMAEAIEAINEVEKLKDQLNGPQKLSAAVNMIRDHFKKEYPELYFEDFRDLTVQFIEAVLSTPQKHEDK